MCRWFIYFGDKVLLKDILFTSKHLIIKQSYQKKFTPFLDEPNKRDHEVNVDGFGVGWYVGKKKDLCLYTSTKPPWNDQNLYRISEYLKTNRVFAHIRAIKPFSNSIVHEFNCHPFIHKNLMFMHNGDIQNFINFKKDIIMNLKEDIFKLSKGGTDSEFAFLLLLNQFDKKIIDNGGYIRKERIKECILNIINTFIEYNKNPMSMNFAFTDGKTIICTRFINSDEDNPPSLYYKQISSGIAISSEPIDYHDGWNIIEKNNILVYNNNILEIDNIIVK